MKRSSDTALDAPAAKEEKLIEAPNWRTFDAGKLNAPTYEQSKGKFGGWYGERTYGSARQPVIMTGPAMRVLYDPDVWDDEKAVKYGKDKKALPADRKSDKWNIELEAPEPFVRALFAYRTAVAAGIRGTLDTFVDPAHPDFEDMDVKTIASKFYDLAKKDAEGRWVFKLDGRCEVGAKDVPMVLEDRAGKLMPAGTKIGRGSLVVPVFNAGGDFVNSTFQNIKVYLKPVKFVVLEHVPPIVKAIAPASVRPQLDQD